MIDKNVEIYDGTLIGTFFCEKFITGKVIKVNEKSIRVHMTHKKCTRDGEITRECEMNEIATFTLWVVTGKNVSFYKHNRYGVIGIVNN